jgi:hypothetical protein
MANLIYLKSGTVELVDQPPGVADAVDGDLNDVSYRRCPFAEAMRCVAGTFWWAVFSGP